MQKDSFCEKSIKLFLVTWSKLGRDSVYSEMLFFTTRIEGKLISNGRVTIVKKCNIVIETIICNTPFNQQVAFRVPQFEN